MIRGVDAQRPVRQRPRPGLARVFASFLLGVVLTADGSNAGAEDVFPPANRVGPFATARRPLEAFRGIQGNGDNGIRLALQRPQVAFPGLGPFGASEGGPGEMPVGIDIDPELEGRFQRTLRYLAEGAEKGDYGPGLTLLQVILNEQRGKLSPAGGGLFLRAGRIAEGLMLRYGRADARVLKQYRLDADGEARGLLGGPVGEALDSAALEQVVERYFLSSVGDEAAFMLGCRAIDRGEFHAAAAAFGRVWSEYPDPTVDRRELLVRWAVAAGACGDGERARWAARRLADLAGEDHRLSVIARAAADRAESTRPDRTARGWPMRHGGPAHDRAMPPVDALSDTTDGSALVTDWRETFSIEAPAGVWGGAYYQLQSIAGVSVDDLVKRAGTCGWTPVGEVVHDDGALYYRTHEAVVCRDRATGAVRWTYRRPEETELFRRKYGHGGRNDGVMHPHCAQEAMNFVDDLGKRMVLDDGALYFVERNDEAAWLNAQHLARHRGSSRKIAMGNALVAVDASTGRTLWRLGRRPNPEPSTEWGEFDAVRFLAPPLPVGGRLVTIVERENRIVLVGLDPRTGRSVFERFIADLANAASPWWGGAALAASGEAVYGLFGRGVVFAASAHDGSIQWVRGYDRHPGLGRHHHNPNQPLRVRGVEGWDANGLFVVGSTLAAAPFDAERLILIDRRSGRLLIDRAGDRPRLVEPIQVREARHVLGVHGRRIVVAAADRIDAYDLASGRLAWRAEGIVPTGRGALMEDAVLIPMGREMLRLDPRADGKRVGAIAVDDGTDRPLGNLFSTGVQVVDFGVGRVRGLVRPTHMLAELNERIETSPTTDAYLARARLMERLGRPDDALDDCRGALAEADEPAARAEACEALCDRLRGRAFELSRDSEAFEAARGLLAEAARLADADEALALRIELDLARLHHRAGRPAEAAARYRGLIDEAGGDPTDAAMIEVRDSAGVRRVSLCMVAMEELRELAASASTRALGRIERDAAKALEAATAAWEAAERHADRRNAFAALIDVAALYPGTPSSRAAIEAVARRGGAMGMGPARDALMGWAELDDPATAATATAGLAHLYADAGWLAEARRQWRRLGERFEGVAISWGAAEADDAAVDDAAVGGDSVGDAREAEPETEAGPGGRALASGDVEVDAGSLSARMLGELPLGDLAPPHGAGGGALAERWKVERRGQAVIALTDSPRSGFQRGHALVLDTRGSTLTCYAHAQMTAEGSARWKIRDPALAAMTRGSDGSVGIPGRFEGHRLLLWDADQVRVYDLLSGKLRWAAPRPGDLTPGNLTPGNAGHFPSAGAGRGYTTVDFADGAFAWRTTVDGGGLGLAVRDAATGRMLWDRPIRDGSLDGVLVSGPVVVAVLDNGQRLRSFDRRTGKPLEEITSPGALAYIHRSGGHALLQRGSQIQSADLVRGVIEWQENIRVKGSGQGAGFLHDGSAWFFTGGHELCVRNPGSAIDLYRGPADSSRTPLGMALSPDGGTYVALWRTSNNFIEVQVHDRAFGRDRRVKLGHLVRLRQPPPTAAHLAWSRWPIPWSERARDGNRYTGEHEIVLRGSDGAPSEGAADKERTMRVGSLVRTPRLVGPWIVAEGSDGFTCFGPPGGGDVAAEAGNGNGE